jgi:hypothetical protein
MKRGGGGGGGADSFLLNICTGVTIAWDKRVEGLAFESISCISSNPMALNDTCMWSINARPGVRRGGMNMCECVVNDHPCGTPTTSSGGWGGGLYTERRRTPCDEGEEGRGSAKMGAWCVLGGGQWRSPWRWCCCCYPLTCFALSFRSSLLRVKLSRPLHHSKTMRWCYIASRGTACLPGG